MTFPIDGQKNILTGRKTSQIAYFLHISSRISDLWKYAKYSLDLFLVKNRFVGLLEGAEHVLDRGGRAGLYGLGPGLKVYLSQATFMGWSIPCCFSIMHLVTEMKVLDIRSDINWNYKRSKQ